MKRRKPDLMLVLAILISTGVLVTGLSQAAMNNSSAAQVKVSSNTTSQAVER